MKIKSMVKYLINNYFKCYISYAGVVLLIIHLGVVLAAASQNDGTLGGMEMMTILMTFIIAITNYREFLFMGIQNGISRRTYFVSSIIVFVLFALIGSGVDTVYSILANVYEKAIDGFAYDSMYEQVFLSNGELPKAADYLRSFAMGFSFDFAALSLGLLISAAFYRLNKVLRIVIPSAMYILIFAVIPFVDYALFDSAITDKFWSFMEFVFESLGHLSLTAIICGAVLLAVSYLFIRRVQIADRK